MATTSPMRIEANQLLLLLSWMSPSFPTGSFAYSHGLEWAIERGMVSNRGDLRSWIEDLLIRGSGWNDAVLFGRCWTDDADELNELALALASSKERWLETTQLGRAFGIASRVFRISTDIPVKAGTHRGKRTISNDYPRGTLDSSFRRDEIGGDIAYPVAAGMVCSSAGIGKQHALLAFLQGFSNTLISVAVRLVPLGQTQGLEVLRDLMPVIAAVAGRASQASLDDLGSMTIASDIASMKHETLQSRVFRT